MKKIRSLMRLIKNRMESDEFVQAWEAATTLKDVFARSRDLAVQNQIDARLVGNPGAKVDSIHPTKEECDLAHRESKRLRHAVNDLDFTHVSWEDILSGLQTTHDQCLSAMEQSHQHPTDSHFFHEWRKRVKDLWYQSEAFDGIHPKARSWAKAARKLSNILGEEHDLSLALSRQSSPESRKNIEQKLVHLRTSAFVLGESFRADSSMES